MAITYLSGGRIQGIEVDRTGSPAGAVGAGTWTRAADDLNTGRSFGGGGGTKTSAIVYGGIISGGRAATTETFNGTTWTISTSTSSQPPTMDTALDYTAGGGNASDAICVAGSNGTVNVTTTETYAGGTAWAAAAAHPVAVRAHGSDGNSVNSLSCGGYVTSNHSGTYTYLGSADAWTTQADTMNYAGHAEYGGTALRGIRIAGYSGSWLSTAETWSYDGSGTDGTWTSIASILGQNGQTHEGTERVSIGGDDTNAIWTGGWEDDFAFKNTTNVWNGSSWAVGTNFPVSTGQSHSGTHNGTTDGAMFSGGDAAPTDACYYWSDPASAVSPIIPTDVPVGTRYEETDTRKIFRRKLTPASTHSQTSENTQEALGHTNHLKAAQRIQAGHTLIGKTVTSCAFNLRNANNFQSGTVVCELLESDGTFKATIGTVNVSAISTSHTAITFTGGAGGEVEADDMLALRTTGLSDSNYLALKHHTSSQEANSHWVDYVSGSWSNQTSKDLYFTATSAEVYSWVEKGTA